MNDFMLASMLMILPMVTLCMIYSQYRERHGKLSLYDTAFAWLAKQPRR